MASKKRCLGSGAGSGSGSGSGGEHAEEFGVPVEYTVQIGSPDFRVIGVYGAVEQAVYSEHSDSDSEEEGDSGSGSDGEEGGSGSGSDGVEGKGGEAMLGLRVGFEVFERLVDVVVRPGAPERAHDWGEAKAKLRSMGIIKVSRALGNDLIVRRLVTGLCVWHERTKTRMELLGRWYPGLLRRLSVGLLCIYGARPTPDVLDLMMDVMKEIGKEGYGYYSVYKWLLALWKHVSRGVLVEHPCRELENQGGLAGLGPSRDVRGVDFLKHARIGAVARLLMPGAIECLARGWCWKHGVGEHTYWYRIASAKMDTLEELCSGNELAFEYTDEQVEHCDWIPDRLYKGVAKYIAWNRAKEYM